MKNLNVSAKSRGVLLFAFNTDLVDYVQIAKRSAQLIEHFLDLPVTIITDNEVTNKFNNRRTGYASGTKWRNGDRYRAYELSPYDETILLDCDYLTLNQSLISLLETTDDYRLLHNNNSLLQPMSNSMGPISLDSVWATVVMFKRSEKTKLLFNLVGKIQRNYEYYSRLYQLRESNFRNDYAFAIANNILNGYNSNISNKLPMTMLTLDKTITSIEILNNQLLIREQHKAYVVPMQNLHIMDKDYLQSENCIKFIEEICQS
jgi:hypothetical protein